MFESEEERDEWISNTYDVLERDAGLSSWKDRKDKDKFECSKTSNQAETSTKSSSSMSTCQKQKRKELVKAVFDSSMSSEFSDTHTPRKIMERNPFRVKQSESFGEALLSIDNIKSSSTKKDATTSRAKSEEKDMFENDSDTDDVFDAKEHKNEKENGKRSTVKFPPKRESTSNVGAKKKPLKSTEKKGTFMDTWVTKGDKKRYDFEKEKAFAKSKPQKDVASEEIYGGYTKQDLEDILNEDVFGDSCPEETDSTKKEKLGNNDSDAKSKDKSYVAETRDSTDDDLDDIINEETFGKSCLPNSDSKYKEEINHDEILKDTKAGNKKSVEIDELLENSDQDDNKAGNAKKRNYSDDTLEETTSDISDEDYNPRKKNVKNNKQKFRKIAKSSSQSSSQSSAKVKKATKSSSQPSSQKEQKKAPKDGAKLSKSSPTKAIATSFKSKEDEKIKSLLSKVGTSISSQRKTTGLFNFAKKDTSSESPESSEDESEKNKKEAQKSLSTIAELLQKDLDEKNKSKKKKGKKVEENTKSISSYFKNKPKKGSEDKKVNSATTHMATNNDSSGSQGQVSEVQETEPGSQESQAASQGSSASGSQRTSLRSRNRKRIVESSDDSDQEPLTQSFKDKKTNKSSSKNCKDVEKSKDKDKAKSRKDVEKPKYRIPKLGSSKSTQGRSSNSSSQHKSSTSKKKPGAYKDVNVETASSESDETLDPYVRQICREVRHKVRNKLDNWVPPQLSSSDEESKLRQSRITEYLGKKEPEDPEFEAIMNEKVDFTIHKKIEALILQKPPEDYLAMEREEKIWKRMEVLRKEREAKEKIENLAWRDRLDALTNEELLELFNKFLPTLRAIESGDHESWRHDKFHAPGAKNQDQLLFAQIEDPFTTPQVDLVYGEVKRLWAPTEELWYEHRSYIAKVLVPECLLFIYQDLFGVNRDDAERRIRATPFRYDPRQIMPDD